MWAKLKPKSLFEIRNDIVDAFSWSYLIDKNMCYKWGSVCAGVVALEPCWLWAVWAAWARRSWTCETTTATSCTTSSTPRWRCWPCSPSCSCLRARGSRCPRRWRTASSTGGRRWAGGGGTMCRCWPPQTQRPEGAVSTATDWAHTGRPLPEPVTSSRRERL